MRVSLKMEEGANEGPGRSGADAQKTLDPNICPGGHPGDRHSKVESRCGAVSLGRIYLLTASFVWRCLTSPSVLPFPHPAHQTGHAVFPHPAFVQS